MEERCTNAVRKAVTNCDATHRHGLVERLAAFLVLGAGHDPKLEKILVEAVTKSTHRHVVYASAESRRRKK